MANQMYNLEDVLDRKFINSLKLINFHIGSNMIFHRIRISNNNGNINIIHYYYVLDNDEYNNLKGKIDNNTTIALSSSSSSPNSVYNNNISEYVNELSICKITNYETSTHDDISANTFKIASCKIRTETKITAP